MLMLLVSHPSPEQRKLLLCHLHHKRSLSSLTERRPLKSTMPLFQSPSSRLNPKDIMEDDRGCSVDGLNLTSSLEGSHNEALHYSFMPSKQIVSLFSLFVSLFAVLCHLAQELAGFGATVWPCALPGRLFTFIIIKNIYFHELRFQDSLRLQLIIT